jgi:hypothetical protein
MRESGVTEDVRNVKRGYWKDTDYLVALQEHRAAVFGDPAAWLPWNYQAHVASP